MTNDRMQIYQTQNMRLPSSWTFKGTSGTSFPLAAVTTITFVFGTPPAPQPDFEFTLSSEVEERSRDKKLSLNQAIHYVVQKNAELYRKLS